MSHTICLRRSTLRHLASGRKIYGPIFWPSQILVSQRQRYSNECTSGLKRFFTINLKYFFNSRLFPSLIGKQIINSKPCFLWDLCIIWPVLTLCFAQSVVWCHRFILLFFKKKKIIKLCFYLKFILLFKW